MDEGSIAFQWEKIIAYYTEYCSKINPLDDHLIDFLQRSDDNIEKGETSLEKAELTALLEDKRLGDNAALRLPASFRS